MPIDKPTQAAKTGESFFRQSGWLMMANIGGGVLMWAVHFLSKPLGPAQYGIFGVLLAVAICVPTIPLQMAVAHQTALALARDRRKELARMIRVVWLVTLLIWLVAALIVLSFAHQF